MALRLEKPHHIPAGASAKVVRCSLNVALSAQSTTPVLRRLRLETGLLLLGPADASIYAPGADARVCASACVRI